MPRQRLTTRGPALAFVGWTLSLLLAAAFIFYGVVLALVAFKLTSEHTANGFSAYRTVYDQLAGLDQGDLSTLRRAIASAAGALAFLIFGYLALRRLPRPYLARHDVQLKDESRGVLVVEPRAIERAAEIAALKQPGLSSARGRYGEQQLHVSVTANRSGGLADTLTQAHASITEALQLHDLPVVPIHLTLTGYERHSKRELN